MEQQQIAAWLPALNQTSSQCKSPSDIARALARAMEQVLEQLVIATVQGKPQYSEAVRIQSQSHAYKLAYMLAEAQFLYACIGVQLGQAPPQPAASQERSNNFEPQMEKTVEEVDDKTLKNEFNLKSFEDLKLNTTQELSTLKEQIDEKDQKIQELERQCESFKKQLDETRKNSEEMLDSKNQEINRLKDMKLEMDDDIQKFEEKLQKEEMKEKDMDIKKELSNNELDQIYKKSVKMMKQKISKQIDKECKERTQNQVKEYDQKIDEPVEKEIKDQNGEAETEDEDEELIKVQKKITNFGSKLIKKYVSKQADKLQGISIDATNQAAPRKTKKDLKINELEEMIKEKDQEIYTLQAINNQLLKENQSLESQLPPEIQELREEHRKQLRLIQVELEEKDQKITQIQKDYQQQIRKTKDIIRKLKSGEMDKIGGAS